ncbi:hypothetical protein [Desulfosporosinus sp.]|uniref:hypothetical protein n=1 Tax=Desulfosporosinus sp. TaxID=157907 RepID=UPI00231B35E2|nr:hypothetical protein [Desulfosporosinus sp.]MDA8222985.1 hypothetical protein [Desulfitobacterium hafniense]
MPNVTVICYLSSLLFYGMGYSKVLLIKDVITAQANTYDYTIYISLATTYFVLAIFFAVIGSLIFYVKIHRKQEIITMNGLEFSRRSDERRRASILKVKAQLSQPEYGLELERRMSS